MTTAINKIKETFSYEDFVAHIEGFEENYATDITPESYFGFPTAPILAAEQALLSEKIKSTAYFSMEYGLAPSIYNCLSLSRPMNPQNQFFTHQVFSNYWLCDYLFKIRIDKMLDIPIYGGGLGVLAGDTLKTAADLGLSIVGIGILWNKGYFKQNFWYKHGQVPQQMKWDPYSYPGLIPLKNVVTIETKEGPLYLRLWKYYIYSYDKRNVVPLILLDSNLEGNSQHFRNLTDQLYRSDEVWWKIFQRSLLGIGGMKAMQSLGYNTHCYHLNEGHAAFAILEKYINSQDKTHLDEIRNKFIFTCHTPVAAGHDRFKVHDVAKILGSEYVKAAEIFGKEKPTSDEINLTFMSLNNCSKVNAVAQKHGEIMRLQFPSFANKIKAITNGVHIHTWLSDSFQQLLDRYQDVFGNWRENPQNLAHIEDLRGNTNFRRNLFEAHQANKEKLVEILKHWKLKEDVFTLGWARRIAGYKRPALIFHHIDQIIQLAHEVGPLQIILSGKAHPSDNIGAAHIEEILDHIDRLNQHREVIRVLILENYDTYFGKLLTSSVDVWLNNPLPPFEASGTSGMKAILNGVLQLSTLDGWVVEAEHDDIGWIFGYRYAGSEIGSEGNLRLDEDAKALCQTLKDVIKLYYQTYPDGELNPSSAWIDKMINCIKRSAFFNTHRMVTQYHQEMWQSVLKG